MGLGQYLLILLGGTLQRFCFLPLHERLHQFQSIVRVFRAQVHRPLQMLAGFGFAPDARRPPRSFAIQDAQTPIRARVVDLVIQIGRQFENLLHFPDDGQCAQSLGPGELAKIHPQIVMPKCVLWGAGNQRPADSDSFQSIPLPLIVVLGKLPHVKAGPPIPPSRLIVLGCRYVCFLGGLVGFRRPKLKDVGRVPSLEVVDGQREKENTQSDQQAQGTHP